MSAKDDLTTKNYASVQGNIIYHKQMLADTKNWNSKPLRTL